MHKIIESRFSTIPRLSLVYGIDPPSEASYHPNPTLVYDEPSFE
jgi:hypothetical protein